MRVIILIPDDSEPNELEWLNAASGNPGFDFLKEPEEDIYTLADGKPFDYQLDSNHADFPLTGLRVSSTLRLHRVLTTSTALIQRQLGDLSPSWLADVDVRLRRLFTL